MTDKLKSALTAAGCPTCPYCAGDGIVPSPEVMRRVQELLIAEGYQVTKLIHGAVVDAGTWSKPVRLIRRPAWARLWKYLVTKALECVGEQAILDAIDKGDHDD